MISSNSTIERYFTHDTPKPILWLYFYKFFYYFSPSLVVIKSINLIFIPLAIYIFFLISQFVKINNNDNLIFKLSTSIFLLTYPVFSLSKYFNQYPFLFLFMGPYFKKDNFPFRLMYNDMLILSKEINERSLVVQFHFMAHFYSNFLLKTKNPNSKFIDFIYETRETDFFNDINNHLEQNTYNKIYIVFPHESGEETFNKINLITFADYKLEKTSPGKRSIIFEYSAIKNN